jgi:hypothetical protein
VRRAAAVSKGRTYQEQKQRADQTADHHSGALCGQVGDELVVVHNVRKDLSGVAGVRVEKGALSSRVRAVGGKEDQGQGQVRQCKTECVGGHSVNATMCCKNGEARVRPQATGEAGAQDGAAQWHHAVTKPHWGNQPCDSHISAPPIAHPSARSTARTRSTAPFVDILVEYGQVVSGSLCRARRRWGGWDVKKRIYL